MAKISIIVPVYNVEQYIHKCIDSILIQTLTDFELILIDDGSKDTSGEICDEYAKKDSRIRVIHKENGGLSSARNAGIDIATSDYLGFVDSDDWIDINMYESLYSGIIDNNADIALCRILYQLENNKRYYFNDIFSEEERILDGDKLLRCLLLNKIDASCCTKLFKSTIFDKIRFQIGRNNEDFNLLYQIFPEVTKSIYVNDVAYNYNIRNGSITDSISSSYVFDSFENANEMLSFVKLYKPNLLSEAESYYFMKVYGILRRIINQNILNKHSEKYKNLRMSMLKDLRLIFVNNYISNIPKLLILLQLLFPNILNNTINIIKNSNSKQKI